MNQTARNIIGALGRLPLISRLIHHESARRILGIIPGSHLLHGNGWDRVHPFDRAHGTDTSGVVSEKELPEEEAARQYAICYAGSQPNIIRLALSTIADIESCCFLDLGCGKGRALLVASERPFSSIVGVELSPKLARIARRNAALFARRYPSRPAVRVAIADASEYPIPPGNMVIFLYHPFGAELMKKVVSAVEAALDGADRVIHVIYYNPVAGQCFDSSRHLHRCLAGMMPYAEEEIGYGPDREDLVIIWQGGTKVPSMAMSNARILLDRSGLRASLAENECSQGPGM